jgi:hypothetical protein
MKIRCSIALPAFVIGAACSLVVSARSSGRATCTTIPTTTGPSINTECPYTPSIVCCTILAGSASQYVRQTQNGTIVIIRRNATSAVTIFGNLSAPSR